LWKLVWKLEVGVGIWMKMNSKKPIRSFRDLEIYQNTYAASIEVNTKITPKFPKEEQYDLTDQLHRSSKAIPRLIAEGYSKKHQKKGFQKYLDDALAESNEIIVSLSHVRDLYASYVDPKLPDKLINIYDKSSRQIYNLAKKWQDFRER
jgi:four helix bundle protein